MAVTFAYTQSTGIALRDVVYSVDEVLGNREQGPVVLVGFPAIHDTGR